MRLGIVSDLITHPWLERKNATVLELGYKLPLDAKQDMTFFTPVVGQIARRILNQAHPDIAEILRSSVRCAVRTGMFRWLNGRPVRRTKRYP